MNLLKNKIVLTLSSMFLIFNITFFVGFSTTFAAEDIVISIDDEELFTRISAILSTYHGVSHSDIDHDNNTVTISSFSAEYVTDLYIVNYDYPKVEKEIDLTSDTIAELKKLPKLNSLSFIGYDLSTTSSLSALTTLDELTHLTIEHSNITDVMASELFKLSNLKVLTIDSTQITSISGIGDMTSLQSLNLTNNQITSLDGIQGLTSLDRLSIDDNPLNSLEHIQSLSALTALSAANCNISDITSISSLTTLHSLNLSNNQIADVTPLANLNNLSSINLNNNLLTDITALKNLTKLYTLDVQYNLLSDINKVLSTSSSALTTLSTLDLSGNQFTDITGLNNLISAANLDSLSYLHMRHNQLLELNEFESIVTSLTYSDRSSAAYNNQTSTLVSDVATNIPLPSYVKELFNPTSFYYEDGAQVIGYNCTVSSDYTTVDINTPYDATDKPTVTIVGYSDGYGGSGVGITVITIEYTGDVDTSPTDPGTDSDSSSTENTDSAAIAPLTGVYH